MPLNFEQISTDLYQKIKVRFPSLQIGNSEGKITSEPNLARFFDFDFENAGQILGRISIALTEKDGMMVLHSADIVSEQTDDVKNVWFDFLKELRQFAKKRLLNFDIRDISKSNLDKRDFQYIAQNSIGEPKMSESKLFGTSKTSYQDLGEVRLIVKHSQPVNLNSVNGRTQHIQSIYLENSQGERFRYPYKHLSGARALASHVAEGGTPYDHIGQHVIGLSEELNKLRQYKNYVFRNPFMIEAMGELTEKANYRIAEIKKQLEGLQRPTYYKQFKESFNVTELKEVPEEVINDWTEKLTIKKFKEDLADVFPYLYKLSETVIEQQEVQELGFEDFMEGAMSEIDIDLQSLANRGDEEDLIAALEGDLGPGTADVLKNMLEDLKDELAAKGMTDVINDYDKMIEILWDKIVDEYGGRDDLPFEPDEETSDKDEFGNVIKHKARHLARKGMRKAMAGEELSYTKENSYWDSFEEEMSNILPEFEQTEAWYDKDEDVIKRVEDYLAEWMESLDNHNAFELAGQMSEVADEFGKHQNITRLVRFLQQKAEGEGDKFWTDFLEDFKEDFDDILGMDENKYLDKAGQIAGDIAGGAAKTVGAVAGGVSAMGKAFKKGYDQGKKKVGSWGDDDDVEEGNEFAAKVQKLKAMGAKPGTKFKTSDGEEHTLKDAIEQAGLKLEDFYGLDEILLGEEEEVKEYVKSHFDYTTNQFPRGETSVLTSVSKKFGDDAVGLAKEAIQELQANVDPEIARIKKLSGM